jgi:hypothetical protein
VAQRYCTNCGAEPREDASFCGKCGRPVHETARVSIPEADVPVPPPPVQDERTAAAGISQDQDMETTEWWQTPIGKTIGILAAIITVLAILASLPGDVVLALLGAVIGVVGLAITTYVCLILLGLIDVDPSTELAKVGRVLFSRLSSIQGFSSIVSTPAPGTRQQSSVGTLLLLDESARGLEKDDSARFTMPEYEDEPVRFKCSEFQTPISMKRADMFFFYDRLKNFKPIHIATHNSVEWWWFREGFYRVEFEEGRPSRDLAAELAVGDVHADKTSLSINSIDSKHGYSADEVAEGVFEMEGKAETGLETAERLDTAYAITMQVAEILTQDMPIEEQDTSHDYGLEKDDSARVFTDRTWLSTRVYIESNVHQPSEVLCNADSLFELASELQNHHPVLIDKKIGQGRLWRSEVVAEWWWFRGNIYVAKREKGYQSESLAMLKENVSHIHRKAKSEAWIPKWTVGNEFEDLYEEGYAPEEIARLVIASEGRPVSLERTFDRVQAGKNAVSTSLNFQRSFQVPWGATHGAINREQFEAYLEKRKQEGAEGLREVRDGGYWFKFKEWDRRRRKAFWSRVDKADYVSTSEIIEDYSSVSRSRELLAEDRAYFTHSLLEHMSGTDFEHYMAEVFRDQGYEVELTPQSGDQGVDLLLKKQGLRIAVQLKRYQGAVGNKAVQEIHSGVGYYDADGGWVITTSTYTRGARQLADKLGIRLIDGLELKQLTL